jgi:hypothetical protein
MTDEPKQPKITVKRLGPAPGAPPLKRSAEERVLDVLMAIQQTLEQVRKDVNAIRREIHEISSSSRK